MPKRANFVARDLLGQRGDMPFDYSAPAELFLAKPMKGSRKNIAVSQRRLRRSVMLLRICARREPSALGCRLETSASIVLKSNACTKTVSIRFASLSDPSTRFSSLRD